MNPRLDRLQAYPFERLARLKAGLTPPAELPHIAMSIGEPQHEPPEFVVQTLRANVHRLGSYPATQGLPELRSAGARWLEARFALPAGSVDPETMILPVNGTREALFSFIQASIDPAAEPLVVMPNPFYQIYEGAALLAGAQPYFLDLLPCNGYLPDFSGVPAAVWQRCQVLLLCSPGNPTGSVLSRQMLRQVLALAEQYDFLIAADECYSEIYADESAPPAGLLQAAMDCGHARFERCIVFHSLSKRSSLPGLRSGFVAGDPQIVARYLLYRTYHGGAMPVPTQLASAAAWQDEPHAAANRARYREKFSRVLPLLSDVLRVELPAGGFYLWPDIGADDERFARELFVRKNVTVLPGTYLSRPGASPRAAGAQHAGPGSGRVRISLVPDLPRCVEAAERIRAFLGGR